MRLPGRLFWLRDWRPEAIYWFRRPGGPQGVNVVWSGPQTWWRLPREERELPGELREVHEGRLLLARSLASGTLDISEAKLTVHASDLRGAWVTDCTGGREGPFRTKRELHRAVRRALAVAEATLRLGGGAG